MNGAASAAAGEVAELLLPPRLSPHSVRPLAGGRTLDMDGATMGTDWRLQAVVGPQITDEQVRASLGRAFATVIGQMSQWEPDSELSRFNRGSAGSRHVVSPQFRIVLDCAMQLARASGGAFDPALGAASDLWGFGAGDPPEILPARERVAGALSGGLQAIEWSGDGASIIQPGGLRLDLSGIAKGFAVDLGLAALERIGIGHALLEIGGELRAIGVQADGMPWWVDIDQPPGCDAPAARIGLTGWAVATSGNYRRRREAEGRSWSHSLDPQTGRPLDDTVRSVTVLHRGCMQADGIATAMMVLGAGRGIAFADAHGLPARIVTQHGATASAAWRLWLN